MSLDALYEQLYDLRSKQSECPLAQRAAIQAQIVIILRLIDLKSTK